MAIQFNVAEQHERALACFDTAGIYYQALGDTAMIATSLANRAECYRFLGRADEAINLGHRYLSEYQLYHTTDVLGNVYAVLAKAYLEKKILSLAEEFNLRSLEIRNQYDFNFQKANNYETQSLIRELRGDYRGALDSYKQFKAQRDSMLNQQKDERITQLLTEYEVEKKDQEISLLASQNEISTLKIERSNKQKLLYGFGALALLIAAVALFFMLRLKSRTNRALAVKNAVISQTLKEKDILLREIHHRVKNNLQMISALLYLHGKSLDNSPAQEALRESQNRVQSMAMIHQNLYQDENLLNVGVKEYLEKLFDHLVSSYNIEKDRISIIKRIELDHLDVDTIVPLALIVNELISNALKYAFCDGRNGEIMVYLGKQDGGIVMEVADNGQGFSGKTLQPDSGFGYKLIRILTERLAATLEIRHEHGVKVRLVIPVAQAA
jgi:two-component sensor histidine kinase